jgi:hypothetical protein
MIHEDQNAGAAGNPRKGREFRAADPLDHSQCQPGQKLGPLGKNSFARGRPPSDEDDDSRSLDQVRDQEQGSDHG